MDHSLGDHPNLESLCPKTFSAWNWNEGSGEKGLISDAREAQGSDPSSVCPAGSHCLAWAPGRCCSSLATRPSLRGLHGTFSWRSCGCALFLIVIRGPWGGGRLPSGSRLLPDSSQREA